MSTTDAKLTRCRWEIRGMDCADCARTIESSLASIPGVHNSTVQFGLGRADVAFDPSAVNELLLRQRVTALGYRIAEPAVAPNVPWLFDVTGMDCPDCAKTLEAGVGRLLGVSAVSVNLGTATLTVTPADDRLVPAAVLAAVSHAGYQARPRGGQATPATAAWWRSRRVLVSGLAAVLWLIGFTVEHRGAPRIVSAIPFLAAMVLAGYPVARAAWFAAKLRRPDMNVLMTVAAVGAIAIGQWDEGASVLILFAVGLTLQTITLERTRRSIQSLLNLAPREATVSRDGEERRIPIAEVAIGDDVIVRPGERIPIDGLVLTGRSLVDQAPITGESVPVSLEPGSTAYAASINGDGALTIRATVAATDTTLARIIHLVEQAQGSRAPAQAIVDRFAAIYTPVVIGMALVLALVGPLVDGEWRTWIFRSLVLLVVACPCALVISTPVALVAAIGAASRRGILFKGGAALETLAGVQAIAFDKTGTLTAGRPAVTDIIAFGDLQESDLLAAAAAIERGATHPIATAILAAARQRDLTLPVSKHHQTIPGIGASATIAGRPLRVGSLRLFPTLSPAQQATVEEFERAGKSVVLLGSESGVEGLIALDDHLRPVSADVIARLHVLGLRSVMLTGDRAVTAQRIAAAVGVDDVRAGLLPADKVDAIRAIQAAGPVAMIGDGINDAPALATADVGIAMGAGGTDVAIEAADVTLMGDALQHLPVAIQLARRTLAIIRQNITAAILVKVAFLLLTFAGVANLWLAVLADTGMSLLVTANALRLMRGAVPTTKAPRKD